MVTIAKITGMPNYKDLLETMIEEIRRNRCRSLSDHEISDLLNDVNDEMIAGHNMFRYLIEETTWSMTGEHPNKNNNWSDMR
jgi:hypothetical protein